MRERKNIEKIQKIENDETLTNTRKKIFENQQIKSRDSVNRKHVSQFILRKTDKHAVILQFPALPENPLRFTNPMLCFFMFRQLRQSIAF